MIEIWSGGLITKTCVKSTLLADDKIMCTKNRILKSIVSVNTTSELTTLSKTEVSIQSDFLEMKVLHKPRPR